MTESQNIEYKTIFRIGYIEAWGRGIRKMNEQCAAAGLPQPLYYYESSGFWVIFRKDLFNVEDLRAIGLNERQINAVMYVKEKGKITNKEYQEINKTSERTALRDLKALLEQGLIVRIGELKSTCYIINNGVNDAEMADKWR